jgi:steroid delta-isomerase-like uncharacterized protein
LSSAHRIIIERYYDALNRNDLEALDSLLAPGLVHHSLPGTAGRDSLKEMQAHYRGGFPDLFHTVSDVVTEGDRTAVRTITKGTHLGTFLGHPATCRQFTAPAISLYRIEGGLIREVWEVFDTISMLQQVGLYTPAVPTHGSGFNASGRRPPGPQREVTLSQIRADPLTFLKEITQEYGDYVHYVCEGRTTILVNQPHAIRHVLHDCASNYTKLHTPDLLLLKPMLGDGLLTTEGPVWKRDREWIQPSLSRPQLEASAGLIVKVVEEMLTRWRRRPDAGTPMDMSREMSRMTLEVAARVLFSSDFASRSEAFGEAMDVLNESMSTARPDLAGISNRLQPAVALIRRTVWQTILARRFYDSSEDDVLGALLRAQKEHDDSDQHVVDQAVTILLAGHETTAKAMSWVFALLDANPVPLGCLRRELDDCLGGRRPELGDLPKLRYTRAIINETLRLDPPIWLVTRTTLQDDEIAGYDIPAGALVAISPYLIHRHPNLWDDPDRFHPERFLADEAATQGYRYLPFGHGPRHCVGKTLATLEMTLALAAIYYHFEFRVLPNHLIEPEALVTMRPRGGLHMVVTDRQRCHTV